MTKLLVIFMTLILSITRVLGQEPTHTEILGKPTSNSISIKMFFSSSVEVSVQYGTNSGDYSSQTPWQTFDANQVAEVIILGLNANTRYYYRTSYRKPDSTHVTFRPEYTFHTQRASGSSFSFVVQADPHMDEQTDTALYRRCLQNQLEDGPDFMIDLGDILMSDKLKNAAGKITHDTVTYRARLLRSYYESTCHSVPLFISLGNHEGEAGWQLNGTTENVAIWGTLDRKKYFNNPSPDGFYTGDTTNHQFVGQRENYYAWSWGNALFIVLDPYWYTSPKPDSLNGWRWTLGKVQYDWLKRTLENSKEIFKFVFAHQLVGGDPDGRGGVEFADLYEWGGNNIDGTRGFENKRPGWYKPIKDLLTEHRTTIFFHGHDHFFGKQEKDCLIYQETPQPGHPNFTTAGQAEKYGYVQGQILPSAGHIRVTVSPEGTRVDYVRAYLPVNETPTRKNKDISATYFIGPVNCYDSVSTGIPILWNNNYSDEIVYPNPFNRETNIEFTLNKSQRVTLTVMDEKGVVIRRLIEDNIVQDGSYQIIWDGKDSNGISCQSGLYFYALQCETDGFKTGKMMLVR